MFSRAALPTLRPYALLIVIGLACLGWQKAQAQSFSVTISGAPDVGNVVGAASGNTVFTIAPTTGAVTRVSGTANRLSSSNTTPVLVTIGCTGGNNANACRNTAFEITISAAGSPSGKALGLTTLTPVEGPDWNRFQAGAPGTSVTINARGVPQNGTRYFYLGLDFTLQGNDAVAPSGASAASFMVSVPSASQSGTVRAFVLRPISLAKNTDLQFGQITRPTIGTTLVILDALDPGCPRFLTGGNGAAIGSGSGCATYSVGGETGGTYSISTPSNFAMTRSGGSEVVTVTLNKSASMGVLGSDNTLRVGGSFEAGPGTPAGAYSGSFVVTVQYN